MKRLFGTVARGLRSPIINEGDDLCEIIPALLDTAVRSGQLEYRDGDILCITESILGRAQGNYASIYDIEASIKEQFAPKLDKIGLIFPILSRNRFSILLKAIALAFEEVVVLLSYPSDEVGNSLFNPDLIFDAPINPWTDVLQKEDIYANFGESIHPFTGVNYIELYEKIIEASGAKAKLIFANNPEVILNYAENVIACDIHTRENTVRRLKKHGARKVLSLTDFLNTKSDLHGYNEQYGLLGSNKASEERLKLFPRDCQEFVDKLSAILCERSGKQIEVMIYGDGAFKDPVAKIWELADPVVSPGFTKGLRGKPNEIKIKYLADSKYDALSSEEQREKILEAIRNKSHDLTGQMISEGTTPRQYTDLLGSMADLVSGSGDKGTPFVYIQGYFDNYSDD